MKKLFALTLALMLALSGLSALADTYYAKVTVDRELAESVLKTCGVPEDQLATVDTALAAINALGINVIPAADGTQIDLDLNGSAALSLAFASDDQGIKAASNLIPNYLLTVTQETINQFAEQAAANMPAVGSAEGSSMDFAAMSETFGSYFQKWSEACAAAGKPGDPVSVEYEAEGYAFDTMTPVTVDMAAITEATRALMDELMNDQTAMSMIKGMAQSSAQSAGGTFDAATFESDFKAGFEEWMSHFPATASAEVYTSSAVENLFYMYAESTREGSETPTFVATMLYVDEQNMKMGYQSFDEVNTEGGFEMAGTDMSMYFAMGEDIYYGLAMSFPENQYLFDLYFLNAEKPLISVDVTVSEGGALTLSLDGAGKTVLAVEDIMNDQSGEAVQGLGNDFMTNGLGALMAAVSAVPELSGLMGAAMAG